MIDFTEFHKWKDIEFSILEAYDCGEYEYSDSYRHCFRVARELAYGWQ